MINEWRASVAEQLAAAFPEAEIDSGEMDGVQRDRDVIAVWWPGWDTITRDVSLATPTLQLRFFPARSKQPQPETPADPAPLEQAADALILFFDRASSTPGFFVDGLSCRLSSLRANYAPDVWRVEGTLTAYTLGAAA